jgi:hypothetical protein
MPIAVIIDAITNSILEVKSNKSFDTDVLPLSRKEAISIHKKDGWNFNWKSEYGKENRQLYQLVIEGTKRIQGLLSIEIMDRHIEMHLIENAPHNLGKSKEYIGAATNLVAFACKISFELGFDGFVSFLPKTRLFEHYRKTLGAERIFKNRMQIPTHSAKKLVSLYYKSYKL